MPTKKRCFSNVKALRRLDAPLLCRVLGKFPGYLSERKLLLPEEPSEESMPYDAIRDACMAGDIPGELDDVLFHVSMLGNAQGWDRIQTEAQFQRLKLDFKPDSLTCADLAMKAWLHDWPTNKELLEQSYARAKIHNRSSYIYFPPTKDVRDQFKKPSRKAVAALRDSLSEYFVSEGLGKGTNVVVYDFDKEIWFLVRYPGQVERHPAIDDSGNPSSHVFKPEEYDAIVYHKVYGDLRVNTNRKREHARYRIDFGHLLFGLSNVFDPREDIVRLNPLMGECLDIFKCEDVPGLNWIAPIEVCFAGLEAPGRDTIWRAERNCSLLDYAKYEKRLLPGDTHSVTYAKFRYRLKDRPSTDTVTIHTGKALNYERDGDSAVLEEWLRLRGFIKVSFETHSA